MLSFQQQRTRLVDTLRHDGYIHGQPVADAFLRTPREDFLPPNQRPHAYVDTPLQIGSGQTISAPHMVAIMCEALDLHPGYTVLEVGTGSGYHAAIVAHIIGTTGTVHTIERFASLAHHAEENLTKTKITNVIVHIGDGSKGLPECQPYDRIYVTAAAPDIPPPLITQLKDGGRLLVPVGDLYCDLIRVDKHGETTTSTSLGGCMFVPLIGEHGHPGQRL